jgi:hypothetical protein
MQCSWARISRFSHGLILLAVVLLPACRNQLPPAAPAPPEILRLTIDQITPQEAHAELLARAKASELAKTINNWVSTGNRQTTHSQLLGMRVARLFDTGDTRWISGSSILEPTWPSSNAVLNPDQQRYLKDLSHTPNRAPDPRLADIPSLMLQRKQFFHTNQNIDGNPPVDVISQNLAAPDQFSCVALLATKDEIGPPVNGRCKLLSARTFGEKETLCPDVPHSGTKVVGFGTAFLVRVNRICTAGHNADEVPITNWRVILGYRYTSLDDAPTDVAATDVFTVTGFESVHITGQDDYCVAELDHPADLHRFTIAKCNASAAVPPSGQGYMVYLAGHPEGLPLSSSKPGPVLSIQGDFFIAPLTEYPGNSGSPVFGANNIVLGLLSDDQDSAHHQQYDYSDPAGCGRPMNYVSDSKSGEYCMRIDVVQQHFNDKLVAVLTN